MQRGVVRIQRNRLQCDERCWRELVGNVRRRFAVRWMHHEVVVFVEMMPGYDRVAHAVAGRCPRVGAAHAHRVEQVLLLLLLRRLLMLLIAW